MKDTRERKMAKKPTVKAMLKSKDAAPARRWTYESVGERSEIRAFVEGSKKWELVACVYSTSDAKAEDLARLITTQINDGRQNNDLLREAVRTLEAIMDEGFCYSTELDADSVLRRIKHLMS
jgi:hypothetical protein